MGTSMGHTIGMVGGVSLGKADQATEGAGVKSMPTSLNGLSLELLEELAALAAEKTASGGLRLMGEGGILPELAQHLMQAALEAEMELHLADESLIAGGRGSRSGGSTRNGYRVKKVMTEVGPVIVNVPRDRLGTFRPGLLPKYAHRTGALYYRSGSGARCLRLAWWSRFAMVWWVRRHRDWAAMRRGSCWTCQRVWCRSRRISSAV
ncbi:transposase (plasmid) [Streptomyces sp. NBC_01426]|nr:transposase [Streptomyces sp. NBC_01426]